MTGGNGRALTPVDVRLPRPGDAGPSPAVPLEPFLELVTEPLCTADAGARLTSLSGGWELLLGRPCDELIGRRLADLVAAEDGGRFRDALSSCRTDAAIGEVVAGCAAADGTTRPLRWRMRWVDDVLYASVRDLTASRLAESALRERERALSTLMSNMPGMAYRCANDPCWTMEFVSAGCEELTGHPPAALVGNAQVAYGDLIDERDGGQTWDTIQAAIERDGAWTTEYRITTATGQCKWVWERGVAVRDENGAVLALEGLIIDHTSHREADQHLSEAAGQWTSTFDAMHDSVAVVDEDHVILRCNAATATFTGLAADEIVGRRCYEVFHGTACPAPDCPHLLSSRSGRAETKTRRDGDRWLRVTFQPTAGSPAHQGVHVVSDITELKHAEERLVQSMERSRSVTSGVIGAIAQLVETRDPYTAGHQRGVGELAAAIAGRLGLDADAVEGVRVAGMLHDVGKTSIPAEILIKPGRLSDVEFRLVQDHPRSGYEILRSIDFPWPVAQAALQHHERLDGSGYPLGLSDGEIVLEARIIGVADVVEAMASHRPYRPALGLAAALAEITQHRGRLYDAAVVDACLAVVNDGFTLPSAAAAPVPPAPQTLAPRSTSRT